MCYGDFNSFIQIKVSNSASTPPSIPLHTRGKRGSKRKEKPSSHPPPLPLPLPLPSLFTPHPYYPSRLTLNPQYPHLAPLVQSAQYQQLSLLRKRPGISTRTISRAGLDSRRERDVVVGVTGSSGWAWKTRCFLSSSVEVDVEGGVKGGVEGEGEGGVVVCGGVEEGEGEG